jgi:hypothetical protein
MNDKYDVYDLSEDHKGLLIKYLNFFKTKQDKFVKEIKSSFEDFKDEKYFLFK